MKRINTTTKPKQIDEVVAFAHNGNTEIIETLDFRDGVRYALEFEKRKNRIASAPSLLKENQELKIKYEHMRVCHNAYFESSVKRGKENDELKSINEELIKVLEGLASYFKYMTGNPEFQEKYNTAYSNALQALSKTEKP